MEWKWRWNFELINYEIYEIKLKYLIKINLIF